MQLRLISVILSCKLFFIIATVVQIPTFSFRSGLIISLFLLYSCTDKSFDHLPTTELTAHNNHGDDLMQDSIKIEKGLFYRKLNENGYEDIYGHRKFVFPEKRMDKPFEIILISCRKEDERQMLVTTIHPTYHSIVDIMAFNPADLKIVSIGQSRQMPSFIDIKFTEKNNHANGPDTTLMQINPQGGIEEMQLCCDF
ncbi:MAG: hypothetical protein HKN76_15110 [Saprospiraceae bacterium]|nr:hypothetical protein [Saprospiraceae bacterium]